MRKISKTTGIHGLEGYSIEQLERMEQMVEHPLEMTERLKAHDVTVVLTNRFGDHNGVMRNVAADFDDNGRTLFFEISSLDDIYRYMSKLHAAGIKPSNMILAAHSAPGQFMVGDDRDPGAKRIDIAAVAGRRLVKIANGNNELEPGQVGFSMHGMRGMARLVEMYMQPSRAIDDDESDAGRKKIIFQACHAGAEVKMADKDDSGEKIQLGMESVISQLGKDLIESGLKTSIDIYGAPDGIQIHRTARGVQYTGMPTETSDGRVPLQAQRMRIENGRLVKIGIA